MTRGGCEQKEERYCFQSLKESEEEVTMKIWVYSLESSSASSIKVSNTSKGEGSYQKGSELTCFKCRSPDMSKRNALASTKMDIGRRRK